MYGNEQTYEWAVEKYGVNVEQIGGEAYHSVELRECNGPARIDVKVHDANGQPVVGVRVALHWHSMVPTRLMVVDESSCDLASGLGMLAGTPHDHLDVTYRYGVLGEQP